MSAATRGIHCATCDTTIISLHRHHMIWCNCSRSNDGDDTAVFVDGGGDYLRYGAGRRASFEVVDVTP